MDAGRSGYWSLGCWSLRLVDQEKTDQRADHDPISAPTQFTNNELAAGEISRICD
jgi:hypothetical protein